MNLEKEQRLGWSGSSGEKQRAWLRKSKMREGNLMWLKFVRQ